MSTIREALSEPLTVAYKRISAVESAPERSHQHEFNGTDALREVLGTEPRQDWPARWIFLGDDEDPRLESHACSWYDARASHPTRSEWRLYFRGDPPLDEDDFLVIVRRERADELLLILARSGSVPWQQFRALLGARDAKQGTFKALRLEEVDSVYVDVLSDVLGVAGWMPFPFLGDHEGLVKLFEAFPEGFPGTRMFSEYARSLVAGASDLSPDERFWAWLRREEQLFRALEHQELQERLSRRTPFDGVEEYLRFSLSILNRRKSRAEFALEHHFEALLRSEEISFSRGLKTEGGRKPAFLLPSIDLYRGLAFPSNLLTMVGVMTSYKARWRQILSEAGRIRAKHLLTLEPNLSTRQLQEMAEEQVILVAPDLVLKTFEPPAALETRTFAEVISEFRGRQRESEAWHSR